MDVARATQHATAVAREAVKAGLADQDAVRRLYQEYSQYLAKGTKGTFTQLLLSRGLIDQAGYGQLQASVPPKGLVPGSDRLESSMASRASGVASLGTIPPPRGEETGLFDQVLRPEGLGTQTPGGSGALELAIPSDFVPASGGQTIEVLDFDPAIVSRPVDSTTGSRGSSGSRPPPIEMAPPAPDEPGGAFMLSDEVEPEELGKTQEEEPPPGVGDTLGHYKLIGTIGRGGMGVIFEAQKKGSDEVVALKVLLGAQDLGSDRRRQRFRREVEAMRRLEHENIVRVFDYGRKGPFDWYTMDYVQGSDFKTLLEDEDGMEYAERIQVFEDMCAAMSHAHERNVIHRDLKPENVLVDKAGRGHVLDFGLAKILDQEIGMTRTGSALGTPYYMAPEQLRSSKHIDQRADVFSLGVILYEITVGVRPFEGETAAEVGNRILTTEPPRPTKVRPDLHPDIDAMVIKALEKDPERRYQDANSLYADLVRHRKGFKVEGASGLSGAVGAARRWASLNRGQLIGVVGGGVVTAVLFSLVLWFALSGKDEPDKKTKTGEVAVVDKTNETTPAKTTPVKPPPVKTTVQKTEPKKPPPVKKTPVKKPPVKKTEPKPPPVKKTPDQRPPPKKDPVKPPPIKSGRTPVEQARLALLPPKESVDASGADEVQANNDVEARHQLLFLLEAKLIPAMAVGDTGRAERALKALRTDTNVQIGTELGREVEHDLETLRRLRRLLGELVRERSTRLRSLSFYGGAKVGLKIKTVLVQKKGLLRVETRGGRWLEVDPLSLQTRTLREMVITRQREIDDSAGHYAMAVVGLWRGLSEIDREQRQHFDKAVREQDGRGAGATARRRKLASWLKDARVEHHRWFEEQAQNAWRQVERRRNKAASCLRALNDFLQRFGRSEEYLERRESWIALRVRHMKSLDRLLKGKVSSGAGRGSWSFRDSQAADFEVAPLKVGNEKNPRPFRAEAQTAALVLENAIVSLPLADLVAREGEIFFASNSEGPITARLSGFEQELHRQGWVVKFQGKEILADRTRKYRFDRKGKRVEWNREGEGEDETLEFFIRHPQVKLQIPFKNYRKRPERNPRLEISSLHDLRLTLIKMSWKLKENPNEAKLLRALLVGRRLLKREAEAGQRLGFLLASQQPGRMTGFLLDGEWSAGEREITASPGAKLFGLQWAEYGVLRFKYAASDGPGVRLHLAQTIDRTGRTVNWHLPDLINPDPDRYRDVTVMFNLPARAVAVVVDGVRLATQTKALPSSKAFFGLEFLHTTKGKIKDFELIQFRPRKK